MPSYLVSLGITMAIRPVDIFTGLPPVYSFYSVVFQNGLSIMSDIVLGVFLVGVSFVTGLRFQRQVRVAACSVAVGLLSVVLLRLLVK